MGDVISLHEEPSPDDLAVACECGSVHFWLLASGEVECADPDCRERQRHIKWTYTDDGGPEYPDAA